MNTFFRESYFRDINNAISNHDRIILESCDMRESAVFDVFLSYNIGDASVVKGIYYALTKQGLKVYLDSIVDPNMMRDNCSKETAQLLKKRLLNSRSLIYASSANASQSKWMAWELGIVDGNKKGCYILPVSHDYSKDFTRKEYLQLYPIIKFSDYRKWVVETIDGHTRDFSI